VIDLRGDARSALKYAETLSPTRPDPYFLEGVLANAVGSTTEALTHTQDALRLKPDYVPALGLLKVLRGE
jgi:hypothetical protein